MKIETQVVGDTTISILLVNDYEHSNTATQIATLIEAGYTFLTSYEVESGSGIAIVFGITAA